MHVISTAEQEEPEERSVYVWDMCVFRLFVSHVDHPQSGRSVGKANAGVIVFEGVDQPRWRRMEQAGGKEVDGDGKRGAATGTL